MPPLADKTLAEVWAWFTSTRLQLIVGGFLLLLFRDRLGVDEQTAEYIRQAVVAAVVGFSLRDIVPPKPTGAT